ncbi:hypothetical protein [Azohydromonas caseinilytica]|uniref:Uncharacterized protein n=1 Tax=Azohydromonas caseinilytica TaxID=2728836 RepID=A0A848EZZ3_9BURK|nr:hypothetical protein [Azohydromonas caseinilytica]NML13377.1 hypothetical protein [Azohydromonas caseinilytica]
MTTVPMENVLGMGLDGEGGADTASSFGLPGASVKRGSRSLPLQKPAKFLVLIDSGGAMVARLFDEARVQVAEFDATSEEVAVMTSGLVPGRGAEAPEWDRPLQGHAPQERREAQVYTLDV